MEKFAQQEGVERLASGLLIRISGTATADTKPTSTDFVTFNYILTLTDGKKIEEGNEEIFILDNMVTGFKEALQMMKPGQKAEFVLPPELGYGAQPLNDIPPYSVLHFTIELLKVVPGY